MRLILDFSKAKQTLCHAYTDVMACIDDETPRKVTITHDGCHQGDVEGPATACEDPSIDQQQAWAVAMVLTRRENVRPAGQPFWDPKSQKMTIPLCSATRRRIG